MAALPETHQGQDALTFAQRIVAEGEHWMDLALSSLSALNPCTEMPLSPEDSENDI